MISNGCMLRFNCPLYVGFILAFGIVAGCSSAPDVTALNEPVCPPESVPAQLVSPLDFMRKCLVRSGDDIVLTEMNFPRVPRAQTLFTESATDIPEVFVGLSISGGGTRAAIFGLSVMKHLDDLGILQHVSAISTTSGGGLAGAYYALNGPQMDWGRADELMAQAVYHGEANRSAPSVLITF